jgi:hypothetical protein
MAKDEALPFGVGGGLVAIKTLLSRDPCVHANTAIEMIDAILKEHPAALRNEALDKMAENARALGLDYEPVQESVKFLANGTRFKTSEFPYGVCINGLPKELSGRWVALVAAEDDCHLQLTAPPAQPAPVQEPVATLFGSLPVYDTPPAAPVQEPVAQWQKRHPARTAGKWKNTDEHDAKWWRDNAQGWEIRALYTTPPAPVQPMAHIVGEIDHTGKVWKPVQPAPVQPMAWRFTGVAGFKRFVTDAQHKAFSPEVQSWYEPFRCSNCTTSPAAQRQWVGLTDEEKRQIFEREDYQGWLDYINAIEAKLKELNT